MAATVSGFVRGIVHNSDDFYILSLEVVESLPKVISRIIKVKGTLIGLTQMKIDVPIRLTGEWVNDAKWGQQLVVQGWTPWSPTNAGVVKFLQECVPGFLNTEFVSNLVAAFGLKTFETLSTDSAAVLGLFNTESAPSVQEDLTRTAQDALDQWNTLRATYELATFLGDHDIGSQHIKAVVRVFGYDCLKVISHNPYKLLSVYGWSFGKVDGVAQRLGIPSDDPRRLEGAVFWCLQAASSDGHLFVRREALHSIVQDLAHLSGVTPFGQNLATGMSSAVDRLVVEGLLKEDPQAGVYLLANWRHERETAEMLAKFIAPAHIDIDVKSFLESYERVQSINLSEAQRQAIYLLVENRVLAITGLPGTGKTTCIRTIVALLHAANVSLLLMSPTGIAAKRLAFVTGNPAGTIHRTFRYDGQEWEFDRHNKYPIGAVVVDESSMVDQELLFRTVDALTPDTMLVLVGDDAQLPSVGPGNVLRELVRSKGVPHVRLTQIFRQKKTSDIVLNSHKIDKGVLLTFEDQTQDSEFRFIPLLDESRAVDLIVQMAVKLKTRDANFQVLSAKYDGDIGVNNLNSSLRDALNPSNGQREAKYGSLHVREGDRLMIIRNNYQLGVYNGDMGKLVSINDRELGIRVHGGPDGLTDEIVRIPRGECVSMLKLAYAITVHKSQGSEFDTVILPIFRTQGRMLLRNLLYTAITRAKKKVWLIGDIAAVHKAIANDNIVQRNTVFGRAINEALEKLKVGIPTGVVQGEA